MVDFSRRASIDWIGRDRCIPDVDRSKMVFAKKSTSFKHGTVIRENHDRRMRSTDAPVGVFFKWSVA